LSTEFASEKILNIGQYLAKIWTKVCGLLLGATLHLVCRPTDYRAAETTPLNIFVCNKWTSLQILWFLAHSLL